MKARGVSSWWQQKQESKRSFKVVVAKAGKQEELHCGGKSGSLKVSSLLLFLSYFCIFFYE